MFYCFAGRADNRLFGLVFIVAPKRIIQIAEQTQICRIVFVGKGGVIGKKIPQIT